MTKIVDARGKACPQPVILTKKALEEGATDLVILVDNETACNNVSNLAEKMGCQISVERADSDFKVSVKRVGKLKGEARPGQLADSVFIINSEELGVGAGELGKLLRKSFLGALAESKNRPSTMLFINTGVKLVAEGSPVIEQLRAIEKAGTEILACGTCLDYFGLKEKVAVGNISNMYNFVEAITTATKVVTF
jgi:selenium metabolism protein YedF